MLDDAWKPQGFSFRLCLDSGVVHLLGFHWQKPFHLQKERVKTPERRSLYEILRKGRNQSPTFNTFRNLAEARSNRRTRWQRGRRRKTDATIYVHRKQKWNFWEEKKHTHTNLVDHATNRRIVLTEHGLMPSAKTKSCNRAAVHMQCSWQPPNQLNDETRTPGWYLPTAHTPSSLFVLFKIRRRKTPEARCSSVMRFTKDQVLHDLQQNQNSQNVRRQH